MQDLRNDHIVFKVADWIRNNEDFFVRDDSELSRDIKHLTIYWKKEKVVNLIFFKIKNTNFYHVVTLFLLSDLEWMIIDSTKTKKWDFDKLIKGLEKHFSVQIIDASKPGYCRVFDKSFKKSHVENNNQIE